MMKRLTVDELTLEGQPGAFAGTVACAGASGQSRSNDPAVLRFLEELLR